LILGRKQSKKDIDTGLAEIRRRYAALADEGGVPKSAIKAFDDRYYCALRAKVGLPQFLEAERLALDELEKKAAEGEEPMEAAGEEAVEERESFIERVTRELYARIERYPSAVLPAGSSFDMEKLTGMLSLFGRTHWPLVDRELRRVYPASRPEKRISIETMVYEYCVPAGSSVPGVFDRYIQAVHGGRTAQVELEEQRCLAGTAKFLFTMKKEIYNLMSETEDEETGVALKKAESFIVDALEDFRMKDLGSLY